MVRMPVTPNMSPVTQGSHLRRLCMTVWSVWRWPLKTMLYSAARKESSPALIPMSRIKDVVSMFMASSGAVVQTS